MVTEFNESNITNIGPQLAEDIPFVQWSPNQYLKGMYRNAMFLLPATPDEIRRIINNLKHSSLSLLSRPSPTYLTYYVTL